MLLAFRIGKCELIEYSGILRGSEEGRDFVRVAGVPFAIWSAYPIDAS